MITTYYIVNTLRETILFPLGDKGLKAAAVGKKEGEGVVVYS